MVRTVQPVVDVTKNETDQRVRRSFLQLPCVARTSTVAGRELCAVHDCLSYAGNSAHVTPDVQTDSDLYENNWSVIEKYFTGRPGDFSRQVGSFDAIMKCVIRPSGEENAS